MIIEQESNLKEEIKKLKENYSPEELKSILNFVKDPVNKLILTKLLLKGENNV